jgi:hypothetical protein
MFDLVIDGQHPQTERTGVRLERAIKRQSDRQEGGVEECDEMLALGAD